MRYLVIAPQLGYQLTGQLVRGGLLQFGRCAVRAMASFEAIETLGIWCQVDPPGVEAMIERTVRSYAHSNIHLDIRAFGGSRVRLALALAKASWSRSYDRVMYLLVNQAVLSAAPFHMPYDVWEIGEELFLQQVSMAKHRALEGANRLLSISMSTTQLAAKKNPGLREGQVVHLCLEPPLYAREPMRDDVAELPYEPSSREQSVMIVGNLHSTLLYKGHQQLIASWAEVNTSCPAAQLWIVGDGDGRLFLEKLASSLPESVKANIHFMGQIADLDLQRLYRRCRVFAMPSTGEGFGLVFVEAARYGVPCIGGKYDSAKEIVVDHETGLLVEQEPQAIAAACIQLLTDDELADRLGNAGRHRYLQMFRFCHFRERLAHALGLS